MESTSKPKCPQNLRALDSRDKDTLGLMLAAWWLELKVTGELDKIVHKPVSLRQFLNIIGNDPIVWIGDFDGGQGGTGGVTKIVAVAWIKPYMDSAFFNYWNHEALRGTRMQGHITKSIYDAAFRVADILLGTTWQPKLIRIHEHLGYKIHGPFDGVVKGEQAYMVTLTKEDFYNSALCKLMERLEAKDGRRQVSHG